MNNVTLDNPYLLFILIPLSLIVIIPFIIICRKRKLNIQNVTSLILHLIICALISLSLANIKTQQVRHETTIYIVADVSSTTSNVIEQMDEYIEEFNEKLSESSKLGIVAFASSCQELVKPGNEIKSLSKATIDKGSTNLENALGYTASLFDEQYKKRIIILSDGKENDGNANSIANTLKTQGIRIDAVYFNSDINEQTKEVLIDKVVANESTFKNSNENLSVEIKSSFDTTSKIIVKDNNDIIYEKQVKINKGSNTIDVDIDTTKIGNHKYVITLENDEDENNKNNIYYFDQEIHEKCEVLVIGNYNDFQISEKINDFIGDFANITYWYSTQNIPVNIESYSKFDEIILSNLDIGDLKNATDFSNVLEVMVSKYGKSLITLGGDETYFTGNYMSTKLKDLLPVDTNPSDTKERTALIMVIDHSGSMGGSRLENAKLGAVQCLDVLTENDLVGVVAFGDRSRVVSSLAQLTPERKPKVISSINSIRESGGTMMYSGLEVAYQQMKINGADFSNKQIILISDGVPGDSGHEGLVQKMSEDGIVLSTMNLSGEFASSFLQNLATIGKGRYYAITTPSDLPDIMLDEVSEVIMESIIEQDTKLNISNPNDPVVDGIGSLPNIDGYNFTKAKYNATTVIDVDSVLKDGRIIENVPLYTYWDYGFGKVASFMTSLNTPWSEKLFGNNVGKKLFEAIVKTNFPKTRTESYLTVETINRGESTNIKVGVPSYTSNMEMRATVISPNKEKEKITLKLSNGVYSGDFNTKIAGTYDLKLEYINYATTNVYTYDTKFTYSYSEEYNVFIKSDPIILWQITNDSGTVSNDINEIVNIEQEDTIYSKDFKKPLLILSLILFVLDIIVRKFKLKDIKSLFKKKDKATL